MQDFEFFSESFWGFQENSVRFGTAFQLSFLFFPLYSKLNLQSLSEASFHLPIFLRKSISAPLLHFPKFHLYLQQYLPEAQTFAALRYRSDFRFLMSFHDFQKPLSVFLHFDFRSWKELLVSFFYETDF